VPRGGLGELGYSGARRQLRLLLDRDLAARLDAAAEQAEQTPEALALALLRRGLA
jgi:hypothetical protein